MLRTFARDARNRFGRLIQMARAQFVAIARCGGIVEVVTDIEECVRLFGQSGKPPEAGVKSDRKEQKMNNAAGQRIKTGSSI